MTQYLLSVHMVEGEAGPRRRGDAAGASRQVDAFNDELQAAGAWVFGGGLHPADTATVVRVARRRGRSSTDGPFAETKEQLGGFWVIEAADLDAALGVGRQGRRPRAWARSRSGRSRTSPRPSAPCPARRPRPTSNGSSVRSPAGSSPPWSASSATSTSPRRWSRRRSWSRPSGGPTTGLPPNPGGWITTTARNRAIDRLRREASRHDRHAQAALLHERDEPPETGGRRDATTGSASSSPAATRRSPRARRSRSRCACSAGSRRRTSPGRSSCPRRRWPSASCGPSRRSATPRSPTGSPATPSCPTGSARCSPSIYLVFNEGYTATERRRRSIRADLCAEAIRLGPPARRAHARRARGARPARAAAADRVAPRRRAPRADGSIVLLPDQDRARWDRDAHRRGPGARARAACGATSPGPYQIQAAINAVHSDAADRGRHRLGARSLALYDQLLAHRARRRSSRSTAPSRVAEVDGPGAGARGRRRARPRRATTCSTPTRADLLAPARPARRGRAPPTTRALALVTNAAERRFLEDRRRSLAA